MARQLSPTEKATPPTVGPGLPRSSGQEDSARCGDPGNNGGRLKQAVCIHMHFMDIVGMPGFFLHSDSLPPYVCWLVGFFVVTDRNL